MMKQRLSRVLAKMAHPLGLSHEPFVVRAMRFPH